MTITLGIMLEILNNYPWTRLSLRIVEAKKRQFLHMVTVFLIIAISYNKFLKSTPLGTCIMLFGTWSQAHAYDLSDYMETMLRCQLR